MLIILMSKNVNDVAHGVIMRRQMKKRTLNELKKEQEALKGAVDMQMEERFKAWWELQHEINALKKKE